MKLLLDTHVVLWLLAEPSRLGEWARRHLQDAGNKIVLSAVSTWEIATKHALGKLPLPEPPDALVARAAREPRAVDLSITSPHALRSASLPKHHNDPFDRLLISQAIVEQAILVTAGGFEVPHKTVGPRAHAT